MELWPSDSRRIAAGDVCGVVLEKLGRLVSEIEPEPIWHLPVRHAISRTFETVHGIRLKELDTTSSHPRHEWIGGAFDYVKDDNSFLVTCKNYPLAENPNFSGEGEEPTRIPASDRAHCLHQAIAFGCDFVWLAVLFGGQEYCDYRLYFSPEEKEAWIKRLAEVWGMIQTGTIPSPITPDQARKIWVSDNGACRVADRRIEAICHQLADWKQGKKALENTIATFQTAVMDHMQGASTLLAPDGRALATWKNSKSVRHFDADTFKVSAPDMYESFVIDRPGGRRFVVK